MSTKLNKPDNLKEKFDALFNSIPEKDKLDIDAKVLMFRFLEIVEEERKQKNFSRKDLAESMGVSPAFVSQLFNGDKLLNLVHLAKLQKALGIEFEIKNEAIREENFKDYIPKGDGKGVWVYKPFAKPDYEKKEVLPETGECFNIVA
jgi:transcriptional regulator with XRE-family HTH domain